MDGQYFKMLFADNRLILLTIDYNTIKSACGKINFYV